MIDAQMATATWAAGETFSMADCAAAPAGHANIVMPIPEGHAHVVAHLSRLDQRPSLARVLEEARPHCALFPL